MIYTTNNMDKELIQAIEDDSYILKVYRWERKVYEEHQEFN